MKWASLLSPIVTILSSLIFLYHNPYADYSPDAQTVVIIYSLLVFPAILAVASYFLRNIYLKIIAFILSLPLALYLGLVGLPSYWTVLIVTVLLYLAIPTDKIKSP